MGSAIAAEYQELYDNVQPIWNPDEATEKLSRYVLEQVRAGEQAKASIVADTWENFAFLADRPWAQWTGRDLIEPLLEEGEVRLSRNVIGTIVRAQVAKSTENRPTVTVLPASDDEADRDCARASERLISAMWTELDLQGETAAFAQLMFASKIAYFKVGFDPEVGAELAEPDQLAEETMEYASETGMLEGVDVKGGRRTGYPRVDALSALEVTVDPGAKKFRDARWVDHSSSRHIDEVKAWWPETGVYVTADHSLSSASLGSSVLATGFGRGEAANDTQGYDHVLVHEYYERPSLRHPEGLLVVVTSQGVVLESGPLPYGKIPFVAARHNPIPGSMYGAGTISDLIPCQKELNHALSQAATQARYMSNPVWLIPKGSVTEEITTRPGQVIEYDETKPPPRPIPSPPLSPVWGQMVQDQTQAMKDLSGSTDTMMGATPSGISGRAIGMLADRDATLLGPTVREIERALQEVAAWLLRIWRAEMPAVYTLKAIGSQGMTETLVFHSADIKSYDVRIAPNSTLPRHPSYRREQIQGVFQSGMLGAPQDAKTQTIARKLMEWGDLETVYGDNTRDRQYAREEIRMMSEGQVEVLPQAWEDHESHIDEHLSFMKSVSYRLLDAETQDRFVHHIAWHYYFLSQVQAQRPFWALVASPYPEYPPADMPGEEQEAPGGYPAQPPVHDAYGPDPALAPPQPQQAPMQPQMDPAMMMQMMQQGMMDQQQMMPQIHGPGVGDQESVGQ